MAEGTLGSLLPPDPSAPAMEPARGPAMGELLASGSPVPAAQGGVINPADVALEKDGKIDKCETLSDLRAKFPEVQRPGSGWTLCVERKSPKVLNGIKFDGLLGSFCAFHEGKDLLSIDGFYDQFGYGDYIVWVEGPSQSSFDQYTGKPKILVKGEIKLSVPERPMPAQQTMFMPPMNPYGSAAHPQVEATRIQTDHAERQFLLERALRQPTSDPAAAQAIDLLKDQLVAERQENRDIRERLDALLRDPGRGSADPFTQSLVQNAMNGQQERIEAIRQGHADELSRLRNHYENEISRVRESYDDRLQRAREDRDREVASLRNDYDTRIDRITREMSDLRDRSSRDEREIRAKEQERFDGLMRLEKETFQSRMESAKNEFERSLAAAKNEFERSMTTLRDDRQRDLDLLENQTRILIEVKDNEIRNLRDDKERLSRKVEELEAKINIPVEEHIAKVARTAEMLGLSGGGGDASEKEEKPDMMETVARIAETPAGAIMMNLLAAGIAQKAGIKLPEGPPALPPGAPPPRQMGPAPKPQPKKKPQPANVSHPAPVQQAQAAPAPQPPQQMPDVAFRGPLPLPEEQMRSLLPLLEAQLRAEAEKNPPTNPTEVAASIRTQVDMLAPGADIVSGFVKWISGDNFCKLLYRVVGGHYNWGQHEAWMVAVWGELEKPAEASAGATSTA